MEDPWTNAWGELSKPQVDPQDSWSYTQHAETDISWATGSNLKWAEPSDTQQSLWDAQLPANEWNPSQYDDTLLRNSSQVEPSQPDRSPSPVISKESAPASPTKPSSVPDDEPPTRSSTPASPSSPDAFGTFETGLDANGAGVDPWGHSDFLAPVQDETAAWAPAWDEKIPNVEAEIIKEGGDEWEAAKQRKERQDCHVPPAVLNSILRQFEELADELWPPTTEEDDTKVAPVCHERSAGIEGEGVVGALERLIPQDLTLPQQVQFTKTFISKHMGEAIRLTRHMEVTRSSPLALYMSSKGSTAWETSVKSRPELSKDDLLPPGWRIMEKEEPVPAPDSKKKQGGGLLSFFGRRGALASSSDANPKLLGSPIPPVRTPPPGLIDTSSPRASIESMQSLPTGSVISSPPGPSPMNITPSSDSLSTPTPHLSPSLAPPLHSQVEIEAAAPASAVSRFLNRFSRNKSSSSVTRHSLALSSDDLEFLSDIVPSADEEEGEDLQLKGLSHMIASSPQSTKLPPPLAPPRASALSGSQASSWQKSPTMSDDILSLSNPISLIEANVSETRQPTIIPMSHVVPVTSSSTSPFSSLTPSLKAASKPSSTFSSPPTSRPHTPLSSKRTPIAIMSTSSSAIPPSSNFTLPPPPSSTQPIILPPPPMTGACSKLAPQTPRPSSPMRSAEPQTFSSSNTDEFSDFYQSPPRSLATLDASLSSAFSDDSLIHSSSVTSRSSNLLDDFDDFVSSPIRTPSPPRPPQKHHLKQQPTSLRSISPEKPQPPLPLRKRSRAADHQRTMSLLETAAARPGRWPAPPSPLPDAIPPPGASEPSFDSDLFAGGSAMQNQQTHAIPVLGASVSSPASFPLTELAPPFFPVPGSTMSPSLLHTNAVSPPTQLKQQNSARIPVTSSGPTTSGGLSAQDLSFFEGL